MTPVSSDKINVAYKAKIILCDLNTKEGPPFWFMRSTIYMWTSELKSDAKHVFIKFKNQ